MTHNKLNFDGPSLVVQGAKHLYSQIYHARTTKTRLCVGYASATKD